MEKILSSILKYRSHLQRNTLKHLNNVKQDPKFTKNLMFSCMDSRVYLTSLLQHQAGESFVVRNAGNFVPHSSTLSSSTVTTDPGALELACINNEVKNVVVCGHSDCKAMHGLLGLRDEIEKKEGSPLQLWLKRNGDKSLEKFKKYEKAGGSIRFHLEKSGKYFEAIIDPHNKFEPADKLSQINTLQQVENIYSYSFLADKLSSEDIKVHALWLDLKTAEFLVFCKNHKRFITVDEEGVAKIRSDI